MKLRRLALAPALLAAFAALAVAAPKPKPGRDAIWTTTDTTALARVRGIALLPAAAFDNDLADEKIVDGVVGAGLRATKYRWIGPDYARDRLRSAFGSDSAQRAVDAEVLRLGRVDSLSAPRLCAALRADAVLSVRIDLFDRIEMEFNQAGKPSTTVQLRAALVDSLGRLLWTASGSQSAEGPYHDPQAGTLGVRSSGLGSTPMTGQGGAPAFDHVTAALLERWVPRFPAARVTP